MLLWLVKLSGCPLRVVGRAVSRVALEAALDLARRLRFRGRACLVAVCIYEQLRGADHADAGSASNVGASSPTSSCSADSSRAPRPRARTLVARWSGSAMMVARCWRDCVGRVRRRAQPASCSSVVSLAQLVAQAFGCVDDQRLQLPDRLRARRPHPPASPRGRGSPRTRPGGAAG